MPRLLETGQAVSDEQLYSEAIHGDKISFEELIGRYEREMAFYLRRYLGKSEEIRDIWQCTIIALWQTRSRFEEGKKFRTWLYSIANHKALDQRRKLLRHRAQSLSKNISDDPANTATVADTIVDYRFDAESEKLEQAALMDQVEKELPRLTHDHEQVVRLAYFQGLKCVEIARLLGIPDVTVRSRLHIAIRKIREIFIKKQEDQASIE